MESWNSHLTHFRVKQKEKSQMQFEQNMQLLVFRLGSHSRRAHPSVRPACQLLKRNPAERVSPALSQHHLLVLGDVAKTFPPAIPAPGAAPPPAAAAQPLVGPQAHGPPALSPPKKSGGVIFSRLSGVILSSPCGPQTCWHILLLQQGQGSSSGAGWALWVLRFCGWSPQLRFPVQSQEGFQSTCTLNSQQIVLI